MGRTWATLTLSLGGSLIAGTMLTGTLVPHADSACQSLTASESRRCVAVRDGVATVTFNRSAPCSTCYTAEYYAAHPWEAYGVAR